MNAKTHQTQSGHPSLASLTPGADPSLPRAQGLYDPAQERDSCGVGVVADMKGRASHAILEKGLQILVNLDHRGATGADATLGDGCGVLTQIPHRFFAEECAKLGFALPEPGHYAIGQFFMPRDAEARARAEAIVAEAIAAEGLRPDRLARHSRRQFRPRRAGQGGGAGAAPSLHRPARGHTPTRRRSSAGCSSCAR